MPAKVIQGIRSHCKTGLMLVSVIATFEFVLFSLALGFVDVSIVAILFETWPLFLIPLMAFLFRKNHAIMQFQQVH